ncbi:DEKNAAC100081 [Brettanomyces naardenensis]|uniref:DEKNAAC100081 n=1 Tax=Brettanomyces naardenensis TaxID=13370 RepID=A0A448YFE5_BRENA|nr:DEKNAAC100081 [Brettanomyces naardenensis]
MSEDNNIPSDEEITIGSRLRRSTRLGKGKRVRYGELESSSDEEAGVISEPEEEDDDDDEVALQPEVESRTNHINKKRRTIRRRKHRQATGNIDDIEDFEENPLFEALSSSDVAISELAGDWVDDYTDDDQKKKEGAVKDLVNFVLRSFGCVSLVNNHDVSNTERAEETIAEVQNLFLDQDSHEYPLYLSSRTYNKEWKGFRPRAIEFVKQLVFVSSERGLLYDDESFMETILSWFGSMSTANERSMRFTATFYSLQLETALCEMYGETTKFINRCQRQLTSEKVNLKRTTSADRVTRDADSRADGIKKRIERIESNLSAYSEKKKYLEKLIRDLFSTFFVHRYRDTNADLRRECISCLGTWVKQLPEIFFRPIYLRYFGWLLTDPIASVRLQALKALIPLYQRPSTISALRQFTSHFKDTFLKMASYETETSVKVAAISVLAEMVKSNFLEDHENIQIVSLIFNDDEDSEYSGGDSTDDIAKITKELAKFISSVEQERYNDYVEGHGAIIKSFKGVVDLDLNEMLKFKIICKVLEEAYDKYLETHVALKENEMNSKYQKLAPICEALFGVPRYNMKNQSLEFLMDYLFFDPSSVTSLDLSLKSMIELDSRDQFVLLSLLYGITTVFVKADENQVYRMVMSRRGRRDVEVAGVEHDRDFYLVKVIAKLPKLVDFFNKDNDTLAVVMLIVSVLQSGAGNIFRATNQESTLSRIVSVSTQTFLNTELPPFLPGDYDLGYFDSVNYPFGLFFKSVPTAFPDIRLRMEEIISALSNTLGTSIDENDISSLTACLIKLRLLCESDNLADEVRFALIDQIDAVCDYLDSNISNSEVRLLSATTEMFKAFVLGSVMQMVNAFVIDAGQKSWARDLSRAREQLSKANKILSTLQRILQNERISFGLRFRAANYYLEILAPLGLTSKYFFDYYASKLESAADCKRQFDQSLGNETLPSSLSPELQGDLLACFAVKESQYATAIGVKDRLNIPLSEVDADYEEDSSSVGQVERELCRLGTSLKLLASSGLVDNALSDRVGRNAGVLGDTYRYNLINSRSDINELVANFKNAVDDRCRAEPSTTQITTKV